MVVQHVRILQREIPVYTGLGYGTLRRAVLDAVTDAAGVGEAGPIMKHRCYISGNKFLYTVKHVRKCERGCVYKVSLYFVRSHHWVALPGLPDYASLEAAETKLDELAEMNNWISIESSGKGGERQ